MHCGTEKGAAGIYCTYTRHKQGREEGATSHQGRRRERTELAKVGFEKAGIGGGGKEAASFPASPFSSPSQRKGGEEKGKRKGPPLRFPFHPPPNKNGGKVRGRGKKGTPPLLSPLGLGWVLGRQQQRRRKYFRGLAVEDEVERELSFSPLSPTLTLKWGTERGRRKKRGEREWEPSPSLLSLHAKSCEAL